MSDTVSKILFWMTPVPLLAMLVRLINFVLNYEGTPKYPTAIVTIGAVFLALKLLLDTVTQSSNIIISQWLVLLVAQWREIAYCRNLNGIRASAIGLALANGTHLIGISLQSYGREGLTEEGYLLARAATMVEFAMLAMLHLFATNIPSRPKPWFISDAMPKQRNVVQGRYTYIWLHSSSTGYCLLICFLSLSLFILCITKALNSEQVKNNQIELVVYCLFDLCQGLLVLIRGLLPSKLESLS